MPQVKASSIKQSRKKYARDEGVGIARKQIEVNAKVPCSMAAQRSYSEPSRTCYTNDQLRKMMRVLAKYPAENDNQTPPHVIKAYDPKTMRPYAKHHQKKAGLIDTLKNAMGTNQRDWVRQLPYGQMYMDSGRIKPRAFTTSELDSRWKPHSDACNSRNTELTQGSVLDATRTILPRAVVVDVLRPNAPLYRAYEKLPPLQPGQPKRSSDHTGYKTIQHRMRVAASAVRVTAGKYYVWFYNTSRDPGGAGGGNHWTVFILDKRHKKPVAHYIDSLGKKTLPKKIQELVNELDIATEDVRINPFKFQRNMYDCGMWAIFFTYAVYKGDTMQKLHDNKVNDSIMGELRKIWFAPLTGQDPEYEELPAKKKARRNRKKQ